MKIRKSASELEPVEPHSDDPISQALARSCDGYSALPRSEG
jgi:hypothetical protein